MGEYSVTTSPLDMMYACALNALPQILRHVTISKKMCTCVFMGQWRIPCRNFIAVLYSRRKMDV